MTGYIAQRFVSHLSILDLPWVGLYGREGSLFLRSSTGEEFGATDFEQLANVARKFSIGTVVHLAASTNKADSPTDVEDLVDANITFTSKVGWLARELRVERFVFVSTFSKYANPTFFSPQTLYAASKRAGEAMINYFAYQGGLDFVILNLYDVYGEQQPHSRLMGSLVKALRNNEEIEISEGRQQVAPIHITDVSRALTYASTKLNLHQPISEFDLRGDEVITVRRLAETISQLGQEKFGRSLRVSFGKPYKAIEVMEVPRMASRLPGFHCSVDLITGISFLLAEPGLR